MKIIRNISKEENKFITKLVTDIVDEEIYNKKTEAVYINCYRENGVDYIYINVIRKDNFNESAILWFSNNNSLIIKRQQVPKANFHLGIDPTFIEDLSKSIIVLDTPSNEYTNLKKRALSFDFSCYKSNNYAEVELDPPLKLVKKIK